MLFAVEGGFISSSASGYSKGISFFLLGRRDDDKPRPMKVLPSTPHNHPHRHHYRLFPEDNDSPTFTAPLNRPPKSGRDKIRPGCARFLLCLGRPAWPSPNGDASLPPLQVGDRLPRISPSGCSVGGVADHGVDDPGKFSPKSSLKKTLPGGGGRKDMQGKDEEKERVVFGTATKRKVQWTDVHGRELTEIREFEPSEVDESGDGRDKCRTCSCIIP